MTTRIAMWSGPRNISTAMMRSFENRIDFDVSDEPLYGAFLKRTGIDHPMADEVMADMECEYDTVIAALTGPAPGGKPYWYQKHMPHHIQEGDDLSWMTNMRHAFLIRRPEEMIFSYAKERSDPQPSDFGLDGEWEIFQRIQKVTGETPPVVDAKDVLQAPTAMLQKLCKALRIGFDPAMLSWPVGIRDTDGIWGAVWYKKVQSSTGFAPYVEKDITLPPELARVAQACRPAYDALWAHRLIPD